MELQDCKGVVDSNTILSGKFSFHFVAWIWHERRWLVTVWSRIFLKVAGDLGMECRTKTGCPQSWSIKATGCAFREDELFWRVQEVLVFANVISFAGGG